MGPRKREGGCLPPFFPSPKPIYTYTYLYGTRGGPACVHCPEHWCGGSDLRGVSWPESDPFTSGNSSGSPTPPSPHPPAEIGGPEGVLNPQGGRSPLQAGAVPEAGAHGREWGCKALGVRSQAGGPQGLGQQEPRPSKHNGKRSRGPIWQQRNMAAQRGEKGGSSTQGPPRRQGC